MTISEAKSEALAYQKRCGCSLVYVVREPDGSHRWSWDTGHDVEMEPGARAVIVWKNHANY